MNQIKLMVNKSLIIAHAAVWFNLIFILKLFNDDS